MMVAIRNSLLAAGMTCFMLPSFAQRTAITEVHDDIRGVTFYSVQISDDAVNEWPLVSGEFAESDRVRLGLSALVLDEVASVEEFVFWIRHEGRRWLSPFNPQNAVTFLIDGESIELEPLRTPQPFVQTGSLVEKIEFNLKADDLSALLQGDRVTVVVRTANGTIQKDFDATEVMSLARLKERVEAHS